MLTQAIPSPLCSFQRNYHSYGPLLSHHRHDHEGKQEDGHSHGHGRGHGHGHGHGHGRGHSHGQYKSHPVEGHTEKDTHPPLLDVLHGKRGFRILSIDGGGIRGVVISQILQEIEHRSQMKIHESFDLLCGTSSGALFALAPSIVHSRSSTLEHFQQLFVNCCNKLFSATPSQQLVGVLAKRARYAKTEQALEEHVKVFVGDLKLTELPLYPMVIAVAHTKDANSKALKQREFLFRNYANPLSPFAGTKDAPIWKAFRAVTAAPAFFTPVDLNEISNLYDAGFTVNNPSEIALNELNSIWASWGGQGRPPVDLFVSLGTGFRSRIITSFRRVAGIDQNEVHHRMLKRERESEMKQYLRIDPLQMGVDTRLGEIKKIPQLIDGTKDALRREEYRKVIDIICNHLADSVSGNSKNL